MGNRILITGGAGFIGSFLGDHFLGRGDTVRILDNLDPQVHSGGKPDYLAPDAELVENIVPIASVVFFAVVAICFYEWHGFRS